MDETPRVLASSTRVLNLGFTLRERLEAVAAREGMDGTTLGRRVVEAAVTAREQAQGVGGSGDER